MVKILIYNDYVHNNQMLLNRLSDAVEQSYVAFCDADDINNDCLDQDVSLFVMPGGADLYYCERLDGAANAKIKRYVEAGGSYLGICAGAYYGASSLEWAKSEGQEAICDTRELAFTSARAIGPVYDYLQNQDFNQSWDGLCDLDYNGTSVTAMYRGGCYFTKAQDYTVVARYADLQDHPPAIIKINYGAGKVVLSGPHIELRAQDYGALIYRNNNPHVDYQRKLQTAFAQSDSRIDTLWQNILSELI